MHERPGEVYLTRPAQKDLDRYRTLKDRVAQEIAVLEENPQAGHPLSGSLKSCRALEFSLPGSGADRAIYVILDAERQCLVFLIGPHENMYKKAERRVAALRARGDIT